MKRTVVVLCVSLALLVFLPVATTDGGAADSPGEAFIEVVGQRLSMEEIPCGALAELPPGAVRCGRLPDVAVRATVHGVAFGLAAEGVPVLSLETFTIPPYQLVGLPGFEPFAQVPGYDVLGYLIDTHRVGVWTREDAIVFTLEALDAPFPLNMPAAATTDTPRP
jgi:hypothetical protein